MKIRGKNLSILFTLVVSVTIVIGSYAQSDTTHYFPPLHSDYGAGVGTQFLYIGTSDPGPVNVTVEDGAGNILLTQAITPTTPINLDIETLPGSGNGHASLMFTDETELSTVLTSKGIVIKSDGPTTSSFRIIDGLQGDILSSKGGSAAAGKTFRAGGNIVNSNLATYNFFVGMMATEDNTTVNISDLPAGLTLHAGGVAVGDRYDPGGAIGPIVLQKGESYVISGIMGHDGNTDANRDGILGALIQADKNIVINNGNLAGESTDFFLDQTVPINKLGKNHILIKGNGNNDDYEKGIIIATADNTVIQVNGGHPLVGGVATPTTLAAGDYFVVEMDNFIAGADHENMLIEASAPIYMYQTVTGATGTATGGLVLIPPFNCYQPRQITIPLADEIANTNIDAELMIFTEAGSILTINGVVQTVKETVAGADYETYKITGLTGNLDIESSGAMAVSLFGNSGAIGIGGAYSGFIVPDTTKMFYADTCLSIPTQFSSIHNIDETILGYEWTFGDPSSGADNIFIANGDADLDSATHTYSAVGVYTTTLVVTRTTCNDTVLKTFNIIGSEANITGTDTVCKDGVEPVVTFTTSVGTPPYFFEYDINGASTYTLQSATTSTTVTAPTNSAGIFVYHLTDAYDSGISSAACPFLGDSITIQVNDFPTASILTNDTLVCKDTPTATNVLFSGSNGSSPYTFTYEIDGTPQPTITSANGEDTVSVSVVTSGAQTFTYTLTNIRDSIGCTQAQSDIALVDVREPASGAMSTGPVTRVCKNEPVLPTITFTGSNGTPDYTFTYTTDTLKNGVLVNTTTHTIATSGSSTVDGQIPTDNADTLVYIITGVADNSGLTCPTTPDTLEFIIDPLPLSIITTPGGANQCFGQVGGVQIDFTAVNVVGQVTFNYTEQIGVDFAAASAAPATIPTDSPLGPITVGTNSLLDTTIFIPAGAVGTTIYSNGISNSNSCAGSGTGTASIMVNPLPEATLALTGAGIICENSTSSVEFTGSIGTPPFTFTYDINGGTAKTVTSASSVNTAGLLIDTLPGTYTINLLAVSDTYNCNQAQTGAVTVTLDPLPTATAGGSVSMCLNGTETVASTSLTDGTVLWTHDGNGGLTNDNTLTPDYTAGAGDAGNNITLTMTVTSDNTCNTEIATAVYTVSVDSLPLAVAGGTATICENSSATVTGATSRFGDIVWTHDGAGTITAGSETTLTPTYNADVADAGSAVVLTMTVTSTNTCAPQVDDATFTINVDPLPTVNAGGTQTICSNGVATISGAANTNSTIVWTENGAGSITAGGTTLTPNYTAAVDDENSSVTLTITATGLGTCNTETATANYTIDVDPLPTATSIATTTICSNGTAIISGATNSSSTVAWTEDGAGTISAGGTNLTPTYTAAAGDENNTVTLIMTATADNTCTGETATANYTIDVDPLPTAASAGTQTICSNGITTISGASNTNSTVAWTEDGAGTITAGGTSLTPTYTAAAGDENNTVTLIMTATADNTCSGETATANYTISVDPLPTANAGGTQTICLNGTAIISGATNTNSTVTWTEDGAGTITAGGTSLTPTYTTAAGDENTTITLTMTATGLGTCSAETATANYRIVVDALPTATAGETQTICSNGEATIDGVTNTNSTVTWTEDGAGTITSGGTTTHPTYTAEVGDANNTVTLTMTATSDNSCTGETATANYLVIIDPLPNGYITNQDTSYCFGDSISQPIQIIGEGINPPYTFSYTINGGNAIPTTEGDTVEIATSTTEEAGEYLYTLVSVTDANGCSDNVNDEATVTINMVPDPNFTLSPEQASVLEPTIDIFDGSLAGDGLYTWDFGDGNTGVGSDITEHEYADTGTYTIRLTIDNIGCSNTTTQTVIIETPLLVYIPTAFSPNGDGINDEFKPKGEGFLEYTMEVYDRWGNMIFYTDDIDKGWDGKAKDGSELAQIDSYVYVVNIVEERDNKSYSYRGVINMLR